MATHEGGNVKIIIYRDKNTNEHYQVAEEIRSFRKADGVIGAWIKFT